MTSRRTQTEAVQKRRQLVRFMYLVTIAGALAMVFMSCTASPLTTDFVRDLGGNEFHFGLLGGIPLVLISLQFFGAFISGRIRRRKPLFMVLLICGRLMYIPAAFLPLLLPDVPGVCWVYTFIVCVAVNVGLSHLATPLWFSWMSDLIPKPILNRYWAERHRYLQLMWTLAFLAVAVVAYHADHIPSRIVFPILAAVGVTAGVIDIVLFRWVREPKNMLTPRRHPFDILMEPLRHPDYRTLVRFNCAFAAATILAAAFMQIYVLKVLGLPRWKTNLVWCMLGVGSAFVARMWGRLADRHGHRPILLMCVALKPLIALVFLSITAENAFPVLLVAFFFDSMTNAGYFIAMNGYRLKMAPRENRSMFIAAAMALSGIAGGLAAIAGGGLLKHTETLSVTFAGRTWINYHLVFLLSFIFRALCIPIAAAIREPASTSTVVVLAALREAWPFRLLMFPVGLYRRATRNGKGS